MIVTWAGRLRLRRFNKLLRLSQCSKIQKRGFFRQNILGAFFCDEMQNLTFIFPYILAYKPISRISRPLKNCPTMRFLQKLAYKPTPKIPWCVVWTNNKRVSISNALMKVHYQSICLGNNITGKLIEVHLKLLLKLSCSLSQITLFSAVSIFMVVCMTEW